jgi:hypothetical protein
MLISNVAVMLILRERFQSLGLTPYTATRTRTSLGPDRGVDSSRTVNVPESGPVVG